jgi:UDP-N-acetylmuramate dehydrogenase
VKTSGPAGAPGASLVAAHPTLIPWMAGIPGTVGGWIKMNAGAFGHSISEVLDAVKIDGEWITAKDCGFAYRTSAIQGEIQDFRLKANVEDLASREGDESEAPESYLPRRAKFPPGTFGSFFKNPPGDYAGRLLEAVGAKGLRVGGACVWEGHANVIVRGEGATPSDVLALAQILVRRVQLRLGVSLEPEVCGLASGSLTGEK